MLTHHEGGASRTLSAAMGPRLWSPRMKRHALALMASMVMLASPVMAGPPLLCFPYEIGSAKSLPWGKDAFKKSESYDASKVIEDAVALLKAEKSTLVRMETIRRATLYIEKDSGRAHVLVTKLHEAAKELEEAGKASAAAWFDCGFAAATLSQSGCHVKGLPMSERGAPGTAQIKKALGMTPNDAAMHFGAALVLMDGDRDASNKHMKRALELVEAGSDLAKSMETNHALGALPLKELKKRYAVNDPA